MLKMTAAFPSRIGFSHLQSWRNRWNCDRFIKKDRRLFEPPLLPILAPATVQNLNKVIERIRLPNRVLETVERCIWHGHVATHTAARCRMLAKVHTRVREGAQRKA